MQSVAFAVYRRTRCAFPRLHVELQVEKRDEETEYIPWRPILVDIACWVEMDLVNPSRMEG